MNENDTEMQHEQRQDWMASGGHLEKAICLWCRKESIHMGNLCDACKRKGISEEDINLLMANPERKKLIAELKESKKKQRS